MPDEALLAFMDHCASQIGDAYFRTPRDTITAFLNLLSVLEQNPSTDWKAMLGQVSVVPVAVPGLGEIDDDGTVLPRGGDDELTNLRL